MNIKQVVEAEANGQYSFATWRKTPSQTTAAGIWFDLSMSPGNPVPNYYAASPTVSVALAQSTDGGIFHGSYPTGSHKKYLKDIMAMTVTATAVPLSLILCDYLLYYPFMDMGITDFQSTTNSVNVPRYTTGAGVKMMAVEVAASLGAGNPQFYVEYTNSDGISGRITPLISTNTQTTTGTIISSSAATALSAGPFLPLQVGDTGVRSIDGITMMTADIGLITLVLVKPLATMQIRGIDAPVERSYVTDFAALPEIKNDAYLNFICLPAGTLAAAPIHGTANFIWG